jgi:hypothetical protein
LAGPLRGVRLAVAAVEVEVGRGAGRNPASRTAGFAPSRRRVMSRADVGRDIEATLGLVPQFIQDVPDYLIESEWASFKHLQLGEGEQWLAS